MALISFKDRIIDLAGSLGSADDNAIQQWIIDGCYDVMDKVGTGEEFAIKSTAYDGPMTVSISSIREIIGVSRNNLTCSRVNPDMADFVDPNSTLGADSIHKSTSFSPVYYITENTLVVKPNPTASEQGYYNYIPEYSITSWDSSSASINNFPNKYYQHVILYSASQVLGRQMLDLMSNSNIDAAITAYKDAITQSANFIDGTATTNNVIGWLNDEDSEMSSAVLNAVSAELSTGQASSDEVKTRMQRDLQLYQWYGEKRDNIFKEYLSKFPQLGNKGGQ